MKKKKRIRRFKYQLWQTFLKATIIFAVINVIVFGCCLDSSSNIPIYIVALSLAWLGFMVWANLPREEESDTWEEQIY